MKTLIEMNDTELFCTLTGSNGIVLQTQLRHLLSAYKAYCKAHNLPANLTLHEMVRECYAQKDTTFHMVH